MYVFIIVIITSLIYHVMHITFIHKILIYTLFFILIEYFAPPCKLLSIHPSNVDASADSVVVLGFFLLFPFLAFNVVKSLSEVVASVDSVDSMEVISMEVD